jgi:hypothetical protein
LRGGGGGGAGEKFVALLHAHDEALQGASAWAHSSP